MEKEATAVNQSSVEMKKKIPTLYQLLAVLIIAAVVIGSILAPTLGWITPTEIRYAFSLSVQKLIEDMHFLLPALFGVLILWIGALRVLRGRCDEDGIDVGDLQLIQVT